MEEKEKMEVVMEEEVVEEEVWVLCAATEDCL